MRKKVKIISIVLVAVTAAGVLLDYCNLIPFKKYDNEDFGIETYVSSVDKDGDGIDDQTDMLNSVKAYLDTNPMYRSKYYQTGYPNDNYGVCTDVVAFGMVGAGYDLQALVDADIKANPSAYPTIEEPDDKIDFRRVLNLKIYFKRNAISLTTDINDIDEWQGGDIVIFTSHIAVVSEHRNRDGIALIYHNGHVGQLNYEEDYLENHEDGIVGHYRIS